MENLFSKISLKKATPKKMENDKLKISLNLWFNHQAEQAAHFYVSVFSDNDEIVSGKINSRIGIYTRYGKAGAKASGMPVGSVMTVTFRLSGQEFVALNGGPQFKFTEAISLIVHCETQEEIDRFWERLSEGGEKGVCGWLKDKYGVSWQVVPTILSEMMQSKETERLDKVMGALLQMTKIDIQVLKTAWEEVEEPAVV
jgi:predicted 3-demethylubiquinone-9 3-methyltransferase (glyoxalase superfamily)